MWYLSKEAAQYKGGTIPLWYLKNAKTGNIHYGSAVSVTAAEDMLDRANKSGSQNGA